MANPSNLGAFGGVSSQVGSFAGSHERRLVPLRSRISNPLWGWKYIRFWLESLAALGSAA
jgi:hypothetical protein